MFHNQYPMKTIIGMRPKRQSSPLHFYLICLFFSLFIPYKPVLHAFENYYSFKQISFEQGLPGVNVRDIYQDSKGILWISIEAMGVCRYAGNTFTLYNNDPGDPESLSSNYVNTIMEDDTGYLWIATDNGLNRYDRYNNKFRVYMHEPDDTNTIPDNLIRTVFRDKKGTIWAGTGKGLARYNPRDDTFTNFIHLGSPETEGVEITVNTIYEYNNKYLYLGTNSGLIRFDRENETCRQWKKSELITNAPVHNTIWAINEDFAGDMWIGTHQGLDKYDVSEDTFIRWNYNVEDRDELGSEGINTIYKEDNGRLWLGSYTSGIIVIDPRTENYFRIRKQQDVDGGLKSGHIRYIYKDMTGILWIGTKFEGLFKHEMNKEIFTKWPNKYKGFLPLKDKYILSFYTDREDDNIYWIGTKFEGLFRFDLTNGIITNYQYRNTNPNGIISNKIQAITNDKEGDLWIGTHAGLDHFDKKTGIFRLYESPSISCMFSDNQNILWLGTINGPFIYNRKKDIVQRYDLSGNNFFTNPNNDILHIYQDNYNVIWFSTRYNGLYGFDPASGEVVHYEKGADNENGIAGNMIRPVYSDRQGNLWIGTKANGLNKFTSSRDTFYHYTTDDGLPTNFIVSIEEDTSGNLWLGTYNGISKFDPFNETVVNYNKDYGLQGNIFEVGVSEVLEGGYMLFGGHNGFNIFHPDSVEKTHVTAPMVITSVKVFDQDILRDISEYKELELKHNENYLSIEFILADYSDPYKHKFLYMLKGLDKEWKNNENRNYVTYNSLDPGEYLFLVRGADELGNWNNEGISMKITITLPFYATWAFRISAVLIVLFAGISIYSINIKRVNRAKEILENQIRERTRKLHETNAELINRNQMIEEQKKEIEMHRSQLERKVQERTRDLEIAKEKAVESDNLKSSFLANMSHEIRTPLNAIIGFSSLLDQGDITPEEKATCFEYINNNSASLLKLIDDIIDISKIEAGQLEIRKDYFALDDIFNELYVTYTEQVKNSKHKIDIIYTAPRDSDNKFIIFSDPVRLRQVLSNLLNNAIKYTNNGVISFGYSVERSEIRFFVKDTGIGISEKDQKTIFDRFVKVEEKAKLYRGTGLGLSISKSLIELMGGKLWLDSAPGKGSVFYFSLPNTSPESITIEKSKAIAGAEINIEHLEGSNIMVVEDEPSNFHYINTALKKLKAEISWAKNGIEAINTLKSNDNIDIILMDLKMPRMNGYEAFEEIKKMQLDIPVIALTAYAQEEDRKKVLAAGFSDYLSKPVSRNELIRTISLNFKAG